MNITVNLDNYIDFVYDVTSNPSKYYLDLAHRLDFLHNKDRVHNTDIPLFLTSGLGLCAEAGEYAEIVKKVIFQGKSLNDDTIVHAKKELGDCFFYWIQACIALDISPEDIINTNIEKLMARYPNGFSVDDSENRKENDI